jgi:poly(hydroxyalkanoate) depolymerase family esterase
VAGSGGAVIACPGVRLAAGSLLVGVLISLLLSSPAAWAGTTTSHSYSAQGHAGSRDRLYKVYVPDGLNSPAPMVMVLHGCRQTHDDVLADWGLTAAADRHGFVLVAPFITTWDGVRSPNCWGFWLDGHRREGRGEPEDLHRIALDVQSRLAIDPRRRFIAGLSSGGAMAAVAAVTHNEYWAAAASAAGLPYGEDAASVSLSGCSGSATFHAVDRVAVDMRDELDDAYPIPLMVLHNEQDCTVRQPAANNLRDAHLLVFGGAQRNTPAQARAAQGACTPAFGTDHECQHTRYTGDGSTAARSIVETVFYSGPLATANTADTDHGHYWIGGENGREGQWAVRQGPAYPELMWDFFARHARNVAPVAGCAGAIASPAQHIVFGRAVMSGWFNLRASASGDRRDIGPSWDGWSRVTLHEQMPRRWYGAAHPDCE